MRLPISTDLARGNAMCVRTVWTVSLAWTWRAETEGGWRADREGVREADGRYMGGGPSHILAPCPPLRGRLRRRRRMTRERRTIPRLTSLNYHIHHLLSCCPAFFNDTLNRRHVPFDLHHHALSRLTRKQT